jgi:hypothetical protein
VVRLWHMWKEVKMLYPIHYTLVWSHHVFFLLHQDEASCLSIAGVAISLPSVLSRSFFEGLWKAYTFRAG